MPTLPCAYKGIEPSDISHWISRPNSRELPGLRDLVEDWIRKITSHM